MKKPLFCLAIVSSLGASHFPARAQITVPLPRVQTDIDLDVSPNLNVRRLRRLPQLDATRVQSHVLAPANIRAAQSFSFKGARTEILKSPLVFKSTPTLDTNAFGAALYKKLNNQSTGFVIQVRLPNNKSYSWSSDWAKTPAQGKVAWDGETRMHVASVSKLLTAIGVARALEMRGLGFDTKIEPYLPAYWKRGEKIEQITFAHLLNQTSGFDTGDSSTDFATMKAMVAKGVPNIGQSAYANMNTGLCRLLLPVLIGDLKSDQSFIFDNLSAVRDKVWDLATVDSYRDFMREQVFSPSGVPNASFEVQTDKRNALAYPFPGNNGWDSGDLSTVAGGVGWRLSASELTSVMSRFRRGKIVSGSRVKQVLDGYFGLDQMFETPAGRIYNKNGRWQNGGRAEQSVAYFLPGNVVAAVFVNSPVGADDKFLRSLVNEAFIESVKE